MKSFMHVYGAVVAGVLSGFDRLRFRGLSRMISNAEGLSIFLHKHGVRFDEFKEWSRGLTSKFRASLEGVAEEAGRPIRYLNSVNTSKEEAALEIAARDKVKEGLVCVLTCTEPCKSPRIGPVEGGGFDFIFEQRECLHTYHYFIDPVFGWMHVRSQTWLPFQVNVYINGREWLCREMDRAGIGYLRRDNCLAHVQDVGAAQALLDAQLKTNWPAVLDGLVDRSNPALRDIFKNYPLRHYWTADQTEWATDVMFKSAGALAEVYPSLARYAITALGSPQALRFLPRRVPDDDAKPSRFEGEARADHRRGPDGVRVKHQVNKNSIKMYDKQGRVLRVETTIVDPRDIKVYRKPEGQPRAKSAWLPLRKGVADLYRRARISQRANERYLESLAAKSRPEPLDKLIQPICRPAKDKRGKRVRALNPMSIEDARLLAVVGEAAFELNGFRNRDVRRALYGQDSLFKNENRKRSAAVSRKLRLLRAHGLIRRVNSSMCYQLTKHGRLITAAMATAQAADVNTLLAAA